MKFHPRRIVAALATAGLAVAALAACSTETANGGSNGGGDTSSAKIAFLMPDQASTRYEEHDRPGFEAELKKVCPGCTSLYNNATADAAKQQQQFNAAISQGVKAIVIDPVDSTAAASLVKQAQSQGVKVIAYDRPIPDAKPDFYVSYDNQAIGKSIAQSLIDDLKTKGVSPSDGGVLQVNGSPTDAAAGLIKKGIHEALDPSGYKILAEYDTPDWDPAKAQQWVAGQVSRFGTQIKGVVAANDGTGGGTIAALKAGGVSPLPPVTGNDATVAGLQLVISGDQYNTINKPSEIVGAAAADAAIDLINGKTPEQTATVFGASTQLFTPTVITQKNIKEEIFDKQIATAAEICTGAYASACSALGIS